MYDDILTTTVIINKYEARLYYFLANEKFLCMLEKEGEQFVGIYIYKEVIC